MATWRIGVIWAWRRDGGYDSIPPMSSPMDPLPSDLAAAHAMILAERSARLEADPDQRRAVRQERSAPLVAELEAWMREHRARLSRHAPVAQAMDYMLRRWDSFTRFLDDGRVCLTNNSAERALRGIVLGRKAWMFAGSDRGAERAAVMYSLIGNARLNDIDPQAWLADVLARIADTPQKRLDELLPCNWRLAREPGSLAA